MISSAACDMRIYTYTLHKSEYETVAGLVVESATLGDDAQSLRSETTPIWPVSIDKLSSGWVGAERVRYVANYQDAESVGYASIEDLSRDHEFTEDIDLAFEPRD